MIDIPNVTRLHGLSATLKAALARLFPLNGEALLFWTYVLYLSVSLFKRYQFIAHYIFALAVIASVLTKLVLLPVSRSIQQTRIARSAVVQQSRNSISVILCAAAIYLSMLTLSSLLQPSINVDKNVANFIAAAETLIFLSLTGLLAFSLTKFIPRVLAITSIVAGAYALEQIVTFICTAPMTANIYEYRLGYIGTDRPIYELAIICAVFLVACVASLSKVIEPVWYRTMLAVSALILLGGVLLTQSRGVYLAALAGIAAIRSWSPRSIRLAAVAIVVIAGVTLSAVPSILQTISWRGESYRLEVWGHYFNLAVERPWLGYGTITKIRFNAQDGLLIPHPHNLILSAQIRGGVLATGAMMVMLLAALYYSGRYAKLTGHAAPLGIIVTLIVAGMFDYDILARSFPDWLTIFFWFPIGICIGTELYVRGRPQGSLPEKF